MQESGDDPQPGRRIPGKFVFGRDGRDGCDDHEPPTHEPETPTPPDTPTTKPAVPTTKPAVPPPFEHDSGVTAPTGFGVVPDPPRVLPEPVEEPEPPPPPPPTQPAAEQPEIAASDPIVEAPRVVEVAVPVPVAVKEAPAAPMVVEPAAPTVNPVVTLTSRVGTGAVALTVILIVLIAAVWFYGNRLASHLTVRRNDHA